MNEEKQMSPELVGGPMAPDPNTPVEVVDIQFRSGAKIYFFDPNGTLVPSGAHVIIETTRGPEFGICTGGNHTVPFRDIVPPLRKVLRIANENDEKTLSSNRDKEQRAFEVCQQKILEHGLDMQLVSAEYAFDGSKILFFFTSDDRVDFRELVKHLAGIFRTRIELRQIGVRDKAKVVGGLGICGRPFCCTEFLDDFQPVSIKMAKTQNLSLNPTKISGTCGRLMCCLKYEQDAYEDLIRNSPKMDSFIDTPDGRGTIVEVNLLRSKVRVRMEDQPENINTYHNSEIYVLRSGKAKKNDPPIPADLAPISGGGKRPRFVAIMEEDPSLQLDPIRFRYRPEDIVEQEEDFTEELPQEPKAKKQEPIEEEEPQEGHKSHRDRRKPSRHGKKHHQNEVKNEQPAPKQPKAENVAPKAEKPTPKAEKPAGKAEKAAPKTEKPALKAEKQQPKAEKQQPKKGKGKPQKELVQSAAPVEAGEAPAAAPAHSGKKPHHRYHNYHRRRKPGNSGE